jgi:hypothetical protein
MKVSLQQLANITGLRTVTKTEWSKFNVDTLSKLPESTPAFFHAVTQANDQHTMYKQRGVQTFLALRIVGITHLSLSTAKYAM